MWNKPKIKHFRRRLREITVILFQFYFSFFSCCATRLRQKCLVSVEQMCLCKACVSTKRNDHVPNSWIISDSERSVTLLSCCPQHNIMWMCWKTVVCGWRRCYLLIYLWMQHIKYIRLQLQRVKTETEVYQTSHINVHSIAECLFLQVTTNKPKTTPSA